MTTQHTEGPLRVNAHFDLESDERLIIAICVDAPAEANARRLAVCWNALQGVPTEEIESIIKIGMPAFSNMDAFLTLLQARRQRDELNELNAELVALCERVSNLGASPSDIAIMNRLIGKAKEQA